MSKPVTNPDLVAAMRALAANECPDNRAAVLNQLLQANFLSVMIRDSAGIGSGVMRKGEALAVLEESSPEDIPLLQLFTDWDRRQAAYR